MFRNYLASALGNLGRNWLYAGITILGLAVSFAAAILIGLYLRDEYTFDRFIPEHERVYRVETELNLPNTPTQHFAQTVSTVAGSLRLDFPEFERIARFEPMSGVVKRGGVSTQQMIVWTDPDFFRIMRYPVVAGDPNAAMAVPDGLVITRSIARRYFGSDTPIGQTLLVDGNPGVIPRLIDLIGGMHPMRVMAVIEDLPSNTHLDAQVFAAARSAFSLLTLEDRQPSPFNITTTTYAKLKPGASIEAVRARIKAFANRRYTAVPGRASFVNFQFMPLDGLHFTSNGGSGAGGSFEIERTPGDAAVDAGIGAVGALIVAIAAINFVTLMTARATRRAVEVGVRKAVGASRRDLVAQFMGEALIYVLIAMVFAVAVAELTLPYLNAFLRRTLQFDYLRDPGVAGAILGAMLLTALLAGLYPALLLSSFRPAATLKGGVTQPAGSASVRQVLVVIQFAILIGLIVMTGTIYRQTNFALNEALRLDDTQVIRMRALCRSAFAQEVTQLPGVKRGSCSDDNSIAMGGSNTIVTLPDRSTRTLQLGSIDAGFFELHGLKPLAGRFFSRSQGADMVLENPGPRRAAANVQPTIVINESALRLLGFSRPADVVGKSFAWTRWSAMRSSANQPPPSMPSQVVGVVSDFTLGTVRDPIRPMLYFVEPAETRYVLFKLDGRQLPETLRAIEAIWKRTGHDRPAGYVFESQVTQELYRDVITQGAVLAILSGLAISIACLGLFALAAFTTERRTKEIGVRKAMGAETWDVVKLLIWQFTKPVLWANLIAWPLAFWAMDHWLHGFAYHVDLPVWLFLSASAAAVLIAWVTVAGHSWLVARAKPATALRYE
jgi:putative ABC transport system permease protein